MSRYNLLKFAIHWMQAYYLAQPFPIERADTTNIPGLRRPSGCVSISQLSGVGSRLSHLSLPSI